MSESSLRFSNLKVGLSVLIGLIIFVFFVTIVGTEQNLFTSTYELKMYVKSVEGLANGSMVTLGGLKIGFVNRMEFITRDGEPGIDVVLRVKSSRRPQITQQSTATIKTIGLLGDRFVDISIGAAGERALGDGEHIRVKPTFELSSVADELQTTLHNFTSVVDNVKSLTDTIRAGKGSVGRLIREPSLADETVVAVRKINAITDAIVKKEGTLGKAVYDQTLYDQLTETTHNLGAISDSLRRGRGSVGKLLMDDSLYVTMHSISRNLDNLVAKANSNSSSVGAALADTSLYRQFSSLMTNFNSLIADIKTNPGKYLRVSVF